MKRLLSAVAVMLALVASGGPATAQVIPWEVCGQFPGAEIACGVVGIHYLPEWITHHPCDANGQAPAGAIDETENLQHWISLVPDGFLSQTVNAGLALVHVLAFPEDRCIRVDGHLTLSDRHYLIFDGNGVTFDQHLRPPYPWFNGDTWTAVRGSHLQWWQFKILGNNPNKLTHPANSSIVTKISAYGMCEDDPATDDNESVYPPYTCEHQAGWGLYGARHVLLEGNETRNTRGDSVTMGWDLPNQPPTATDVRFVRINNHKVFGAGRQGISSVSGQDIMISNSYIEGATQVGIDIEQTQPLHPVRRWTIVNNDFGQSYATIAQLGTAGTCTEVSDIQFSNNRQLEPNVTGYPSLQAIRAEPGQPACSAKRGPLTITHNSFWVEEYGDEGERVTDFRDYSNVTFNFNSAKHSCYGGAGCVADEAAVGLMGGSGNVVNRNNFAVTGSQAWQWVYAYRADYSGSYVNHDSLGVNVNSCGNTTSQGTDQPNPCFPPLP